ncbi:glycosyltransferase [Mixta theicola]|uniref:Glycosyltransferase n=1 Tax=Mixta theicola TaxID=1458355 RepID=A0A2K1Q6V1_9GAMM|nr:glycosyltransferase family 9 protein [Mixta theicola]PNS10765.1 glycosyltransferase [Mixta theicola]GLR08867.1 glycosyl transferase [Mixta theicola]
MNYILVFILLLPLKWIRKLFHKKEGRNLVIQTAKIGDFVNITPLLTHLQHSDALLSRTVAPLAQHDDTLQQIWYIEDHKSGLLAKIRLALQLMNRYDNVYLLHPNNLNLFYAACCNAANKRFLSHYRRKWYQGLFYWTADSVVQHEKNTLTLENYLKLADPTLTKEHYSKHATQPLYPLAPVPATLQRQDGIRIGLSISAGNQAKTIPPSVWKRLFDRLADLPCLFYVFGAPSEMHRLQELYKVVGERENIISLIGAIPLEGLPHAISMMDFYIASDSGNVYIADAVGVPVILIYGPCCVEEQRPLGDVLLIGPDHIAPSSFVFAALYQFHHPAEQLYALDSRKLDDIYAFIAARQPKRLCQTKPH